MQYEIDIHLENNELVGNLDQLKKQIDNDFKQYANLVEVEPTAERIEELSAVRTKANKLVKVVDGRRKEVTQKYRELLSTSKAIVDDCMSSATLASKNITAIINEYENKDKKLLRRAFTIECNMQQLEALDSCIKEQKIKVLKVEKGEKE